MDTLTVQRIVHLQGSCLYCMINCRVWSTTPLTGGLPSTTGPQALSLSIAGGANQMWRDAGMEVVAMAVVGCHGGDSVLVHPGSLDMPFFRSGYLPPDTVGLMQGVWLQK
jgi:hypothetical protein